MMMSDTDSAERPLLVAKSQRARISWFVPKAGCDSAATQLAVMPGTQSELVQCLRGVRLVYLGLSYTAAISLQCK